MEHHIFTTFGCGPGKDIQWDVLFSTASPIDAAAVYLLGALTVHRDYNIKRLKVALISAQEKNS